MDIQFPIIPGGLAVNDSDCQMVSNAKAEAFELAVGSQQAFQFARRLSQIRFGQLHSISRRYSTLEEGIAEK
jgi:hypothetical protein